MRTSDKLLRVLLVIADAARPLTSTEIVKHRALSDCTEKSIYNALWYARRRGYIAKRDACFYTLTGAGREFIEKHECRPDPGQETDSGTPGAKPIKQLMVLRVIAAAGPISYARLVEHPDVLGINESGIQRAIRILLEQDRIAKDRLHRYTITGRGREMLEAYAPSPREYLEELPASRLTEWERGALYGAMLGPNRDAFVRELAERHGWRP